MGLDAIAITDHEEIEGAFAARRLVHERQLPLAVIPGTEVSIPGWAYRSSIRHANNSQE